MSDMKHLDCLKAVALGDVEFLTEREKTYQGSWKKSGGRSAWFMLRRKIDRLLVMMARPPVPDGFNLKNSYNKVVFNHEDMVHLVDCYSSEDIFLKIEAQPGGEDGTVLAEIRDLRRYLCLVESEMVARGVVVCSQSEISEFMTEAFHNNRLQETKKEEPDAEQLQGPRKSSAFFAKRGSGVATETLGPGTPDDGGHHELRDIQPWFLSPGNIRFRIQSSRVRSILYCAWTRDWWHLEESYSDDDRKFLAKYILPDSDSSDSTLVVDAMNQYSRVGDHWVLRVAGAPKSHRDRWSFLRHEVNAKEHAELQDWKRGMYDWDEGGTKFVLKGEHAAWVE